nr:hypothetical protein [Tanacetum cinerariifolium]
TTSKELYRLCKQYGNVINVFIPNRRTKLGKRIGFVRFIKILDVVCLVNNLCTIWIGKFKLHVNIARFNRPLLNKGSHSFNPTANVKPASDASYKKVESRLSSSYIQAAKVGISSLSDAKALKPALVLDDSCAHEPDLALSLAAKVGISSLYDAKALKPALVLDDSCAHEPDLALSLVRKLKEFDVEGVPLCAWSHNTFTKIASIWGTLLYDEDKNSPHFHRKRLCIKTSFQDIIFTSQKIIVKGKMFLIRVKELTGRAPSFNDNLDSDDESIDSQEASILKDEFSDKNSDMEEIPKTMFDKSEHVGNISPACNKVRMETRVEENSEDSFNIYDMLNNKKPTKSVEHSDSDIQYPPEFTPCDRPQEMKMEKVDLFNIRACWGNINFDYVVSPSVGNSCGILCIWDPSLFYKENSTVLDYFIAIMGNWLPNNKKLLVIPVYAPQDGFVKVPSGGFSFTWSHRFATKMSRLYRFLVSEDLQRSCPNLSSLTLDRYLFVHRPILLRELNVDYGHTLFRFFHNWFDLDGFDSFISDTWCNINIIEPNAMFKMAKKLKILKGHIRVWVKGKRASASNLKKDLKNKLSNIDSLIDKRKASSAILEDRLDTMNKLASLENMESIELAQKAKNNLAIRGIMVDRDWMEDPAAVKKEFFSHFQNRFEAPCATRLFMDMEFPNRLSSDQALDLERHFSKEEIKGALSHLFYADDAIFIAQCKLIGIAVENSLVTSAANNIGCMTLSLPFSYLGVNVGGHMSRIASWDVVINKVLSHLSKWKMKVLSVGAPVQVINKLEAIRSHFFHGVDPSVRKMMLVKWNNVLASKEMGGLGVSSFYALNHALIFKWVWRFHTQGNSIWTKVIKALHGEEGNLDWPTTAKFPSNWLDIIRSFSNLYNKGVDLLGSIKKKAGNGENTIFLDEFWKGEETESFLSLRLETILMTKFWERLALKPIGVSLSRL